MATRPTVLIFVQIATHFGEMFRVAELLRTSRRYDPVMLFMSPYEGSAAHLGVCRARDVACIAPGDLHRYLPTEPAKPRRWARARHAVAGASAAVWRPVRRTGEAGWRGFLAAMRLAASFGRQAARRSIPLPLRRAAGRGARLVDPVSDVARRAVAASGRSWSRLVAALERYREALWRISRSALSAVAKGTRRLLLSRVPTIRELSGAWRIPRPLVAGAVVLASVLSTLAWPLLWVLRPGLRRGALVAFGLVYTRWPAWLPPDVRAQRYVRRLAPTLVRTLDVRLLVIPEDNFYYFTNVLVRAVQDRGGRAVIVPFTIVNTLEWAEAFYRLPQYDTRTVVNLITSFLFPRWVHRHKGASLIMPPQQVLSNEYLGIAPSIPWLINSGHADAIAAESRFMEEYYLTAGIPADRLRRTGSLTDDVLFRQLAAAPETRRRLSVELGFPADRPLIVCALPPNQLAGSGRQECEFHDYDSVLRAFLEPLDDLADEYNVVLALHPRTTSAEAAALAGCRARRSTRNVAELIPLGHIFVACCSATIRLAITCGIPVVNYDVFVYDYDDYKGVPGVATISSQTGYREALTRLARSTEQYEDARRRQAEFAGRHTVLDGHAGERLLTLFDELSREGRGVGPAG